MAKESSRLKLLRVLKDKKRLLNDYEIIDFYVENIMKDSCQILWTNDNKQVRKEKSFDWQIKPCARTTYLHLLGGLVKAGHLKVTF